MCTLSIFKNAPDDEIIITMNRDEQRIRREDEALLTEHNRCYPIDPKSQGTWIGINHHGIALALLNRYQDQHIINGKITSRGAVIPKLLECKALQEIVQELHALPLQYFNPFNVVAATSAGIINAAWNGKALDISEDQLDKPFFLSSSSERLHDVLQHRQKAFQNFTKTTAAFNANNILNDLHLNPEENTTNAILMSRENTHTKSITQITLNNKTTKLSYWPEDRLSLENKPVLNEHNAKHHIISQHLAPSVIRSGTR